MTQPRGVVVGIRDLRRSLRALDWAAEHAARTGRVLTVCHVLPDGAAEPTDSAAARAAVAEQGRLLVESAVGRVRQADAHLAVEQRVERGPVAAVLLGCATAADEVVIGAGLRVGRLGSVAARLAARAPCPVTVVRGRRPRRREVVVGVDGSDHDRSTLDLACRFALAYDLPVRAVHAYRTGAPVPGLWTPAARQPDTAHRAAIELVAQIVQPWAEKFPEIALDTTVAAGDPADVLTTTSTGSTLLVVGSRGHRGLSGLLLSSVSQTLLDRSSCPVTVAH